eukprot:gnl/TRDRNA2_/TRDRNA2_28302_c0_seq2.p1 gnl/TRDRNA2_/TRDRNA2_28302_c0~~gnl/TRDRNA2_/TRDRNA2_28302_c0_seq2.p1  ORF type:complete len:293 (+),score=29.16 gnl/TRDRNA2_/TRDRNA2_28302_c0_seq2:239-1117(+)
MVVLAAIYVERLLSSHAGVRLTVTNWRPILVAGLLLASKTWEDVSPWNAEFSAYLHQSAGVRYPPRSLYSLESRFLAALGYRADVAGELYAAYYFALKEAERPRTPSEDEDREAGGLEGRHEGRNRSRSCDARLFHSAMKDQHPSAHPDASTIACSDVSMAGMSITITRSVGDIRKLAGDGESVTHIDSTDNIESIRSRSMSSNDADTCYDRSRRQSRPVNMSRSVMTAVDDHDSSSLGWQAESARVVIEADGMTRRHWQLDRKNPYLGYLRHARRAGPPSSHLIRRPRVNE